MWQMQLRFYWDEAEDDCVVRQVNSASKYGYEYQVRLRVRLRARLRVRVS